MYGGTAAPRSHRSYADDKALGDLIPKMQALNLLENKIICSTLFYRPLYPVQHQHQWHPEGNQCKWKRLGIVTRFRYMYLAAVVSHNGSKPKVPSRIAKGTVAPIKKMPVWRDSHIFLRPKVKPMPSHAISIFLYACVSGTFTVELEQRNGRAA